MLNKIFDFYSPFAIIGKYLYENKIARIMCVTIFIVSALAGISIGIYSTIYIHGETEKEEFLSNYLPAVLSPALTIVIFFGFYAVSKTTDKIEIQLEKLEIERKEITEKIEKEKELDIFNTIQLSLNQLNEYYTINKGQARSSFRFSIFSIIVGLITIVTGIWLVYFEKANIQLAFISGISGTLLEFIGGAYFFMYKKALNK